jgi:hypothetical protein
MSGPNVKTGLMRSAGLVIRYRPAALRAGRGMNKSRTCWHRSNPASPFRLCSRDLTPAAGSRSGRRQDDVEADQRPGTVPEIAAVGRRRARGDGVPGDCRAVVPALEAEGGPGLLRVANGSNPSFVQLSSIRANISRMTGVSRFSMWSSSALRQASPALG